jgi:hypothetical protein
MGLQRAPNDADREKATVVINRIGARLGLLKESKASNLKGDKGRKPSSRRNILSV